VRIRLEGDRPALTPTMRTRRVPILSLEGELSPNALSRDLVASAIVNDEFAARNMPVMNSAWGKLGASIDP
jgi:hypothetical protein